MSNEKQRRSKRKRPRQYLTTGILRNRYWSPATVSNLLGEPDLLVMNPLCWSYAPVRLYEQTRVYQAEESDAFRQAAVQTQKRSEIARKSVEVKKQKTVLYADKNLVIKLSPDMTFEKVTRQSVKYYNQLWRKEIDAGRKIKAHPNSPPDFLIRITINYVRQALTNYDESVDKLKGKTGKEEARQAMKEKILKHLEDLGIGELVDDYRAVFDTNELNRNELRF